MLIKLWRGQIFDLSLFTRSCNSRWCHFVLYRILSTKFGCRWVGESGLGGNTCTPTKQRLVRAVHHSFSTSYRYTVYSTQRHAFGSMHWRNKLYRVQRLQSLYTDCDNEESCFSTIPGINGDAPFSAVPFKTIESPPRAPSKSSLMNFLGYNPLLPCTCNAAWHHLASPLTPCLTLLQGIQSDFK